MFAGGSLLILLSQPLAKLLFLNDFFEAWIYTPILIYAFILSSFASFYGSIYTAGKKTSMLLISTVLGAAVNLILNVILVRRLQIYGIVIATTAGYAAIYLVRMFDSKKIMNVQTGVRNKLISNILIIAECLLIMLNKPVGLGVAVICTISILFIYRSDITAIIQKTISSILKH